MRLWPQGHQIPDWAESCPRCDKAARSIWQHGKPKPFNPAVYFDDGADTHNAHPSASKAPPPSNQLPNISHKATPQPRPTPAQAAGDPPPIPGMIFRGIKDLLKTVSAGSTLDSVLAQACSDGHKIKKLLDAHHPFIMDLRARWFDVFAHVLVREEARVIARDFGLDGRRPVKSKQDLAQRCHLSVGDVTHLKASGLRKLSAASSRSLIQECIVEAARPYLN